LLTKGAEIIPDARVDTGNPGVGAPVPPGDYTVKLTVDGQPVTGKLTVKPDPRVQAETAAQFQLALQVRDDITKLSNSVIQLRAVRRQLQSRNELLKDDEKSENLRKQSKELIKKLDALEENFHNPKAKITYDIFAAKGGAKLYSQLTFIYGSTIDGDGPPTQGVRAVYAELTAQLQKLLAEFETGGWTRTAKPKGGKRKIWGADRSRPAGKAREKVTGTA